MLLCPHFTLTWYPGTWPSTSGPLVLQSANHYVERADALGGLFEQMVQVAEFLRGETPDYYIRGNRTLTLEWQETRIITGGPGEALATALAALESLPDETGWLSINIPDEGRTWVVTPCAIRSAGWSHVVREGKSDLLRLRWTLLCGPLTEIVSDGADDTILLETGAQLLTEEGENFELETAV